MQYCRTYLLLTSKIKAFEMQNKGIGKLSQKHLLRFGLVCVAFLTKLQLCFRLSLLERKTWAILLTNLSRISSDAVNCSRQCTMSRGSSWTRFEEVLMLRLRSTKGSLFLLTSPHPWQIKFDSTFPVNICNQIQWEDRSHYYELTSKNAVSPEEDMVDFNCVSIPFKKAIKNSCASCCA